MPISSIPTKLLIAPFNNGLIRVRGLYYIDPSDNNEKPTPVYFTNTAVVKATLIDANGVAVTGCNNLTLTYTGASGNFNGVVQQPFSPSDGTGYILHVVADFGAAHAEWSIDVEVQLRNQ